MKLKPLVCNFCKDTKYIQDQVGNPYPCPRHGCSPADSKSGAIEMSAWVSVEDRLPESRCMAYTPTDEITIQYRFIPAGMFTQIATDATHWQPLPQPPEGQEMSESYRDQIQIEYDTDGHEVVDSEGSEIDRGIQLNAALSIAEEADDEIAALKAEIKTLKRVLKTTLEQSK